MNLWKVAQLLTVASVIAVMTYDNRMSGQADPPVSMNALPEAAVKALSEKRIYFGHMSVGSNIVEGLKDLMNEDTRLSLNIVETNDPSAFGPAIFAHSRIGKNHDPFSKIEDFRRMIENGIGDRADVAFFKFCFVDITAQTDVDAVFRKYREVMSALKAKYPKTTFVHVTVPLTTVQSGPKATIKKIIGRPVDRYADNVKSNEFNNLLRKGYVGSAPVFDLAAIESVTPEGKETVFSSNGLKYFALNPGYTHDRGHLNQKGRKIAARRLLALLAGLYY